MKERGVETNSGEATTEGGHGNMVTGGERKKRESVKTVEKPLLGEDMEIW